MSGTSQRNLPANDLARGSDDESLRAAAQIGRLRGELDRLYIERDDLLEIARTVSSERDIGVLLETILRKCRHVTRADGGSLYVVSERDGAKVLRFRHSQNDSLTFESSDFTIPFSIGSIAGAAAVLKRTINIPDVRALAPDLPFRFDDSWDRKTGYITRSIIAAPLRNREGEVLGVVQLLNRKTQAGALLRTPEDVARLVRPFDRRDEELLELVAAQAGISLHNAMLYDEIQGIFEGFIRASVYAIEQRDPATRGHSQRVSTLTRALAEAVDRTTSGPYADVHFSREALDEIGVAGLLHDFGKVWVPEALLQKPKKLFPQQMSLIRSRFDYIRKSIEAEHQEQKCNLLSLGSGQNDMTRAALKAAQGIEALEECWRDVCAANEPTVLKAGGSARIEEMARQTYRDVEGREQPFLTAEEVKALLVAKGSLTPEELEKIRSHVRYTVDFLSMIPWGARYGRVPDMAGSHHEALNGSGYPKGLQGDAIPLESRMMLIADIYDALTAADRPYKPSVPVDRAIEILRLEARDGRADPELLRIFIADRVYSSVG